MCEQNDYCGYQTESCSIYMHHSGWMLREPERLSPEKQRTHMPIPELKKLKFLLRFQEWELAALRRHRNPDANAIALNERKIAQLKDKIARLTRRATVGS